VDVDNNIVWQEKVKSYSHI